MNDELKRLIRNKLKESSGPTLNSLELSDEVIDVRVKEWSDEIFQEVSNFFVTKVLHQIIDAK